MTKKNKKGMRIKDVGATINLGNYSSLHITIGEESEFAGLDLAKAETYLRNIAESVEGTLNLPERSVSKTPEVKELQEFSRGDVVKDFAGKTIFYNNGKHIYADAAKTKYTSVTTMLGTFYPFDSKVVAQEYMDFASSFGNLIHTSIQNAIIGKPPKKTLVSDIVKNTLDAVGEYDDSSVEQILMDPDHEIAGRFDILTRKDDENTLWDVKTNSDLFMKVACSLPAELQKQFGEYWNVQTIFGEHCLQLNLYTFILEKYYNVKIDKIKIIHIPDGFKEILDVPKVDVSALFDAYARTR